MDQSSGSGLSTSSKNVTACVDQWQGLWWMQGFKDVRQSPDWKYWTRTIMKTSMLALQWQISKANHVHTQAQLNVSVLFCFGLTLLWLH